MRRIEVTFPMPLNLANARMHWRTKHTAHLAWRLRAIVQEKLLRGRHRPMQCARATVVLYVGRVLMDHDNAVARLKWCLDLLK